MRALDVAFEALEGGKIAWLPRLRVALRAGRGKSSASPTVLDFAGEANCSPSLPTITTKSHLQPRLYVQQALLVDSPSSMSSMAPPSTMTANADGHGSLSIQVVHTAGITRVLYAPKAAKLE